MDDAAIAPGVQALETLNQRVRTLASYSLSMDMEDRWGARTPEDRARLEADIAENRAQSTAARAALEAAIERARAEDPDTLARWIDANDEMLVHFIAKCDASPTPEQESTARFVANEERGLWAELRRGERRIVEQNVFFVQRDRVKYRALFGIDP